MLKFCIWIITFGVFLTSVEANVYCLFNEIKNVGIFHFFKSPVGICIDVEERYNRTRAGLEKCTRHQISLDGAECVANDFCLPGSNFRQSFDKSHQCLSEKLEDMPNCIKDMVSEIRADTKNEEFTRNATKVKEICTRSFQLMLDCSQELAEPCGDEAKEVFKRLFETVKGVMIGVCFEAAGIDADLIERETLEHECIIEVSVRANSYEATASKATAFIANYASIFCLMSFYSVILGILIPAKWIYV